MKSLYKRRSGISVLVSNVLMLLVVVVAASIVFAYVNIYVENYQRGSGAALMERLLIEDVWFTTSGIWLKNVEVTVYNYGEINTKLVIVFIGDESADVQIELGAGEHKTCKIDFRWMQGRVYTIKVLTERGYLVEGNYASP